MQGLGVHSSVWSFEWSKEAAERIFPLAAEHHLPFFEFTIADPATVDAARVRALSAKHGVAVVCSPALTPDLHPATNPDGAVDYMKAAAKTAAACGSTMLCGVTYGTIGVRTGAAPTVAELDTVASVLDRVAAYARTLGVEVGVEAINRYETHLINTAAQAVTLIEKIGAPNIFVHLDTYHMNSEEAGLANGVVAAGPHLKYLHMSESHRGVPGTGTLAWDELFGALVAIGFKGGLALEAFVDPPPHFIEPLSYWRPVAESREAILGQGLTFLRQKAAQYGL